MYTQKGSSKRILPLDTTSAPTYADSVDGQQGDDVLHTRDGVETGHLIRSRRTAADRTEPSRFPTGPRTVEASVDFLQLWAAELGIGVVPDAFGRLGLGNTISAMAVNVNE